MIRGAYDVLPPATDTVRRTVQQIRIEKDRRLLTMLVVLILVPPGVTGLVSLLLAPAVGLILGVVGAWIIGAATTWIGFKALAQVTTIDHA